MCIKDYSYIKKNYVLSNSQCGFESSHSTALAVCYFIEKVSTSIDKGYHTIGMFLDLSKAFDTINHDILRARFLWHSRYLASKLDTKSCRIDAKA